MTPETYQRWLECTCGTCRALADVAHDRVEWDALFERTKQFCATASQHAEEPRQKLTYSQQLRIVDEWLP